MTDKSYADKDIRPIIYAADIGGSHITLMAGRVDSDGKVTILGVERELCRGLAAKGLLDNPTEAAQRLVEMSRKLKNRISQADMPRVIFVSLGGKNLQITSAEVDRSLEPTNHVTHKVLREMERECRTKFENAYPTQSVAEVIWGTFTLDGRKQMTDPLNEKAKMIHGDYELYFGPRQMRQQWEECMSRQNQLKVGCYFVSTEALRSALVDGNEWQEGCAIISFGSDTTTYCAYQHGQLLDLLVVPLGSHNITKDIAYKAISISHAERLKKRATSLIPLAEQQSIRVDSAVEPGTDVFFSTDALTKIASAREEEILRPIIERINENADVLDGKTLFITGGGARLRGLVDFLQDRVPMSVVMGSVINKLSDESDTDFAAPEYSQIIGTLILGAEYTDIVAPNLVKEEKPKPSGKRSIKERIINFANNLFDETQDLAE